jgi:hypothetical protein
MLVQPLAHQALSNPHPRRRSRNRFAYKLYVKGKIDGVWVDKKYCAISHFLEQFGGDQSSYGFTSRIVTRLCSDAYRHSTDPRTRKWRELPCVFQEIREPRQVWNYTVVVDEPP